ncbi:TPA: hypothetical protein ACP3ZG_001738 [Pseudomonas aeruginosa]|uniref:hypothetical protein n=1 Tax=Pseudomonas TaxID=286 RepID=UPI0011473331|nr:MULTISPECIES: hypothetical protein [Pseudomonas]ELG7182242.1 hypothetical protein [Pseudomonas aeruginosa]MBH4095101.1 hypothetical protein [Pseudomonas aeruginosa]MBI6603362.1 hypothetical protein [Pseudomonas sp. S4_EA_1b]MBI8852378.1 hypothetical protein [Pseudomonas aeruginosa]HCF9659922.1 hypothetical protein [Pseudomonas aeruginosa]
MDIEQFIREAAARGWSKTQTRLALEMSSYKFWAILGAMPALTWAKRGTTLGNKLGNARRKTSAAVTAAITRARASRREKSLYNWNGLSGTITELARHSPAGETTIRRRLKAGMPVDQAFSLPANNSTPNAGWRTTNRKSS